MAESLADAIHAAVRVGKLGPNSTYLTERGHMVRLTPGEAAAPAERMAGWLAAHDAELLARQRSQIVAGVDAALSGLDRILRAWMVPGLSPEAHERSKRWLRGAWPVLAAALDSVEGARLRHRRDAEHLEGLMREMDLTGMLAALNRENTDELQARENRDGA